MEKLKVRLNLLQVDMKPLMQGVVIVLDKTQKLKAIKNLSKEKLMLQHFESYNIKKQLSK